MSAKNVKLHLINVFDVKDLPRERIKGYHMIH